VPARLADPLIDSAVEMTQEFIGRAANAFSPREAADWALAAKNMAATVHSLVGAVATKRRQL
jgi:hypothetical protein